MQPPVATKGPNTMAEEARNGEDKNGRMQRVAGATAQTDNRASIGDNLSSQVDAGKGRAADTMRNVAHIMRDQASNAPVPGVDRAAEAAARPLEQGAQYLEQHTPADMWSDTMSFCREHPAGALFLGFSLGYMVKKLMP